MYNTCTKKWIKTEWYTKQNLGCTPKENLLGLRQDFFAPLEGANRLQVGTNHWFSLNRTRWIQWRRSFAAPRSISPRNRQVALLVYMALFVAPTLVEKLDFFRETSLITFERKVSPGCDKDSLIGNLTRNSKIWFLSKSKNVFFWYRHKRLQFYGSQNLKPK